MQTDVKQAYVSPEFRRTEVVLEGSLCAMDSHKKDDPIVDDGYVQVTANKQNGWDTETSTTKGFIDNTFGTTN